MPRSRFARVLALAVTMGLALGGCSQLLGDFDENGMPENSAFDAAPEGGAGPDADVADQSAGDVADGRTTADGATGDGNEAGDGGTREDASDAGDAANTQDGADAADATIDARTEGGSADGSSNDAGGGADVGSPADAADGHAVVDAPADTAPAPPQLTLTGMSFSAIRGTSFTGPIASVKDTVIGDAASGISATIDWGDGSATTTGAVGGSAGVFTIDGTHTYGATGMTTVTVTVQAPSGARASTTLTATVGTSLSATGASVRATQGVPTTVTVGSVTDSGATASGVTVVIDWGDGSAASAGTVAGLSSPFAVSGAHTFIASGALSGKITVTDVASGATAQATFTAAVMPQLSSSATAFSATQNVAFTGQVATFVDANTTDTPSALAARIDWGDSTTSAGTIASAGAGAFTVSGSHTYAKSGSVTVSVTVTDAASNASSGASLAVVVGPEVVVTGVAFSATAGITFNQGTIARVSDAITLGGPTGTVDWGDGTAASAVGFIGGGGAFTANGTHLYASSGTFTVTIRVQVTSGATATAVFSVTVQPLFGLTVSNLTATHGVELDAQVASGLEGGGAVAPDQNHTTATIDWGDGTAVDAGSVFAPGGASFSVSGGHTYVAAGIFTVTVTVTDTARATSSRATFTVTVS